MFSLNGKTAVVIGGGGHVCSALAEGFAAAGANVAIIDLRIEKATMIADKLKSTYGIKSIGLSADVTMKIELQTAINQVISQYGGIEIAVNGAGINSPEPFLEIEEENWHKVVDSQLTATYLGCQVIGSHMVSRNKGSIINISSASADPA
ncbi:MAG: SDR family NAD(P)-dependent oxidoreductase, partial [Actinobacteria bacterium]|nr:SDR family NAD(P)-dependent oxidoreductase [Actinomycetota bacterium]